MRIQTPILYLASNILFYLVFFFVPYIVAFLFKKNKYFKEYSNSKIFLSVLKLQLIFLFFTMIIPFVLLSIFSGSVLNIFADGKFFIFGLPMFITTSALPVLVSIGYSSLESWIILLICLAFFESWRRFSLRSLKKNLSVDDKETPKNFLTSIVIAVLLSFLIGYGILTMLHSQYFYCSGNILCKRTSAYYNFKR